MSKDSSPKFVEEGTDEESILNQLSDAIEDNDIKRVNIESSKLIRYNKSPLVHEYMRAIFSSVDNFEVLESLTFDDVANIHDVAVIKYNSNFYDNTNYIKNLFILNPDIDVEGYEMVFEDYDDSELDQSYKKIIESFVKRQRERGVAKTKTTKSKTTKESKTTKSKTTKESKSTKAKDVKSTKAKDVKSTKSKSTKSKSTKSKSTKSKSTKSTKDVDVKDDKVCRGRKTKEYPNVYTTKELGDLLKEKGLDPKGMDREDMCKELGIPFIESKTKNIKSKTRSLSPKKEKKEKITKSRSLSPKSTKSKITKTTKDKGDVETVEKKKSKGRPKSKSPKKSTKNTKTSETPKTTKDEGDVEKKKSKGRPKSKSPKKTPKITKTSKTPKTTKDEGDVEKKKSKGRPKSKSPKKTKKIIEDEGETVEKKKSKSKSTKTPKTMEGDIPLKSPHPNEECYTPRNRSIKLEPHQISTIEYMKNHRGLVVFHGMGKGKCHGKDTPIIMSDGTVKMVQHVSVGDNLMGDDGTPRLVESLATGKEQMYDIQVSDGSHYTVNESHILSLIRHNVSQSTLMDIPLKKILKNTNMDSGDTIDIANLYGFKVNLGKKDSQNVRNLYELAQNYIKDTKERVVNVTDTYNDRLSFIAGIIDHSMNDKTMECSISTEFKIKSDLDMFNKGERIVETFNLTTKNKDIYDTILLIYRSLGGICIERSYHGIYYIDMLPNNVCNKLPIMKNLIFKRFVNNHLYYISDRSQYILKKINGRYEYKSSPMTLSTYDASALDNVDLNYNLYTLSITKLGVNDYYGFVLDGNKRYLIADMSVTHNTMTAIASTQCMLKNLPDHTVVVLVPSNILIANFKKEMKKFGLNSEDPRYIFFTFAKFQKYIDSLSILNRDKFNDKKIVIVDEVHYLRTEIAKSSGKRVKPIIELCKKAAKVMVFTGTLIFNKPYDIANPLAMIKGTDPLTEYKFDVLNYNANFLVKYLECCVSYQKNIGGDKYPERRQSLVNIEMTPSYYKDYSGVENKKVNLFNLKDPWVFLTGMREASLNLTECLKCDWVIKNIVPLNEKTVIFSNFDVNGIQPLVRAMERNKTRFGIITGTTPEKQRLRSVAEINDPNSGVNFLLITNAGGTGVDLKGIRHLIIMDRAWNSSNEEQVIYRAIRLGSHLHLPKNERYVDVIYLNLVKPKKVVQDTISNGLKFVPTTDELLQAMIERKDKENQQFINILENLSIENKDCDSHKEIRTLEEMGVNIATKEEIRAQNKNDQFLERMKKRQMKAQGLKTKTIKTTKSKNVKRRSTSKPRTTKNKNVKRRSTSRPRTTIRKTKTTTRKTKSKAKRRFI
jgi:hypothetical protein